MSTARAGRPATLYQRACEYCGDLFTTRSRAARFCSQAHKQAAYRIRRDSGQPVVITSAANPVTIDVTLAGHTGPFYRTAQEG